MAQNNAQPGTLCAAGRKEGTSLILSLSALAPPARRHHSPSLCITVHHCASHCWLGELLPMRAR